MVVTMIRSRIAHASPLDQVRATPPVHGSDALPSRIGDLPLSARRRRITVPLVLLALILLVPGVWILLVPQTTEVGTPLGAAADLPGGLARINGVIPLESDGWLPPEPDHGLSGPTGAGMHRVRILLEITALEASGIGYEAAGYAIDGLGDSQTRLLWASPEQQTVQQGQSLNATLVFEIPDQSVALALTGENGVQLALGAGHHKK